MNLIQLQQVLTKADPAAVLVSPRVVERVVQEVCDIRGVRWVVPHSDSYVADRSVLFRHVEQEDLTLQTHQLLPARVILLARPKAEELMGKNLEPILHRYWRRLFHANIHLVLEDRWKEGLLTDSDIRSRIDEIGKTEFEEIRMVLSRDGCLPDGHDDRAVYIEFAAFFLELRCFSADLVPVYFPALRDPDTVEQLMRKDIDAQALFQRTRLDGAPEPGLRTEDQEYESHEYYWKLVRHADRAAESGNKVKAAIVRTKAARVAPAMLSPGTRAKAEAELKELTQKLAEPLHFNDEQSDELLSDLKKLLEKADQGQHPVEASILYELQKVCLDHEKEIYALGPVEWLLSVGKRPIKRPLPSQRMVRIIRHLRSAIGRLASARLADADRDHLAGLLQWALHDTEERLRNQFRPILVAVMEDVGLKPSNSPERVAFHKMIEEFLDRILESGFVTFGDLRDAISRNQLKLPDLSKPEDFIQGDPLLRLDRRLAAVLDGVYRPSEIYTRWLERLTALNFGTKLGRFITRFVTVPFGGAFLLIEIGKILADHVLHQPATETVSEQLPVGIPESLGESARAESYFPWLSHSSEVYWSLVGVLGVFFLGLLHSRWFRKKCLHGVREAGLALKKALIDFPVWLVTVPQFQRAFQSWPVQLSYWYALKPGLACGLLYLLMPGLFQSWLHFAVVFVVFMVLLNTRTGMSLTETLAQTFLDLIGMIRSGLLTSLFYLIDAIFKQVTHFMEYVLFKVDELLRFRKGEGDISLGIRIFLSIMWFPVSFVLRFYVIVLIEPMINPLKLPISAIAGKILYPMLTPLMQTMTPDPALLSVLLYTFVWLNLFLLPDAFGFLIWEMKENWSLYRANRSAQVEAVPIGGHGETMLGLLKPGFHSGTIPKLFTRLRRAEQQARESGSYRIVRGHRRAMQEIKEHIARFVTRELVSLVHQSAKWEHKPLHVGEIHLASNRVDVELRHADFPGEILCLQWEWRSQWLMVSLRDTGWLKDLSGEAFWAFAAALTYLYKLTGVDLVHEQIQLALPNSIASYDLTPTSLVIWLDRRYGRSVSYDLEKENAQLTPQTSGGEPAADAPVLEAGKVIFARMELRWSELVRAWTEQGEAYRRLVRAAICDVAEPSLEEMVLTRDEEQRRDLQHAHVLSRSETNGQGNGSGAS